MFQNFEFFEEKMGSPQPYSLGGTTNGSVKWPNDSDMYFTVLRGEV